MRQMKQKTTVLEPTKYQVCKNNEYKCKICDYISFDASNFNKHLNTSKHKMKQMKCMVVNLDKTKFFQCKYCEKILKSRTTLWRHEKKCNNQTKNESINAVIEELDKLKTENNKFQILKIDCREKQNN